MNTSHRPFVAGCFLMAANTFARDEMIDRLELRKTVERIIEQQSKGAAIRGITQETEGRQITYEAEMLVNGQTRDVQIDTNGAVLEIEEPEDLRAQAGRHAKAGKGNMMKVESVTKKDKMAAYRAERHGGRKDFSKVR